MKAPRIIITNPCDKSRKDLSHLEKNVFHCSSCDHTVTDISNLEDVDYFDYHGKCIIARQEQLDDMKFVHPFKRFAVAVFLVFGSSLFIIPETYGQIEKEDKVVHYKVYGVITGKVVGKKNRSLSSVKVTVVLADGTIYTTTTEYDGTFSLEIPRKHTGSKVEIRVEYLTRKKNYSKTIPLTINNLSVNNVGTIKLNAERFITIGCPTF